MEYIVKGFKIFISAFSTLVFLNGCASTQSKMVSNNSNVIKYESRCGKHEYTKEENLADTINNFLVSTKAPKYPIKAARNGTQGYTKLEFDVSPEGKPININVIEAYPSSVFNNAAIESLSGWRYKSNASVCHSIQLDFKMG
jgi:TonB family protein